MPDVFVDTSFFIALVNKADPNHTKAKSIAAQFSDENWTGHLTVPILFEIGDGFSRLARREIGTKLIQQILESKNYLVHRVEEPLLKKAIEAYTAYNDKEWGLTDGYSFEFMKENGLRKALTFDHHFSQAGFETLE